MHGGNVWKWMIGPLAIYAIEFGKRLIVVCCSDRGRGRIISLRLLPNQVKLKEKKTMIKMNVFTVSRNKCIFCFLGRQVEDRTAVRFRFSRWRLRLR